jgi:hypothetical protein
MKVNPKKILTVDTADVRCKATVDLISKVQRPYLFRVTVTGEPPHGKVRKYDLARLTETEAAMDAMKLFVSECEAPTIIVEPTPWY